MEMDSKAFLAEQVADPELREKLTPKYHAGCKRILLCNDYYSVRGCLLIVALLELVVQQHKGSLAVKEAHLDQPDDYGNDGRCKSFPISSFIGGAPPPDRLTTVATWSW